MAAVAALAWVWAWGVGTSSWLLLGTRVGAAAVRPKGSSTTLPGSDRAPRWMGLALKQAWETAKNSPQVGELSLGEGLGTLTRSRCWERLSSCKASVRNKSHYLSVDRNTGYLPSFSLALFIRHSVFTVGLFMNTILLKQIYRWIFEYTSDNQTQKRDRQPNPSETWWFLCPKSTSEESGCKICKFVFMWGWSTGDGSEVRRINTFTFPLFSSLAILSMLRTYIGTY